MLGDLSRASVERSPFAHMYTRQMLDLASQESLLSWFEQEAKWAQRSQPGFYDTLDTQVSQETLTPELRWLCGQQWVHGLRDVLSTKLQIPLGDRASVMAFKMIAGYRMGIHTDYGPLGQICRIFFHLNRGWDSRDGGWLMLFAEEKPLDGRCQRIVLPESGGAFAFHVSERSFHAVSPVERGDRFTLSYSFYTKTPAEGA